VSQEGLVVNPGWLVELQKVLQELHGEAVEAHIEFEVLRGEKDSVFLAEFEHCLSHVVKQVVNEDNSNEIPHIRSHLQRIIIEAREYVAEEYAAAILSRLNPFIKHPTICKLLQLERPMRTSEFHQQLKEIKCRLIAGRRWKGHDSSFDQARTCFKEAVRLGAELDADVPISPFRDRSFNILNSAVFFLLGSAVTIIVSWWWSGTAR
jgi:hypothetical protein